MKQLLDLWNEISLKQKFVTIFGLMFLLFWYSVLNTALIALWMKLYLCN